jgi:transglutaminase-like putative cysteine protease
MTRFLPRTLLFLVVFALLPVSAPAAEPQTHFDRWYVLLLENQPAGWTHAWVTQAGEVITTHEQSQVSVKRGPIAMTIHTSSDFDESADGKPIAARMTQKLGAMEVQSTMTFGPKLIEVVTTQGQQSQTQTFPLPREPWLPPAAAQRQFEKHLAAGDKEMSLWTLSPATGPRAIQVNVKVVGQDNVEVLGKVVPAIVWESTMSIMPGIVLRSYVDEQGQAVKNTMAIMPGLELTMLQADKELALRQVNPPEMLVNTLVTVPQPIEQPRQRRRGVYELTFKPGDAGGNPRQSLAQTAVQKVTWASDTQATVTVDLDAPAAAQAGPVDDKYRRASINLNSDDEAVKALLPRALGPEADKLGDAEKAEKLRRFVHQFIDAKDLSVGLATASEVARTAQGDCTEHGMLLAALLRAAGIPSRTVTGLVYADGFVGQRNIFGYHMWTQAWLRDGDDKGRWLDLDATIDEEHPFDATHIAMALSAQENDSMTNDLVAMLPVIGRLSIRVVE